MTGCKNNQSVKMEKDFSILMIPKVHHPYPELHCRTVQIRIAINMSLPVT